MRACDLEMIFLGEIKGVEGGGGSEKLGIYQSFFFQGFNGHCSDLVEVETIELFQLCNPTCKLQCSRG